MPELSEEDIKHLIALSRIVRGARGGGGNSVTVSSSGITISGSQARRPPVLPDGFQWVKVTGASSSLGNGVYDARIQIPNGTGTITAADDFSPSGLLKDLSTKDDCELVVSGDPGHSFYAVNDYVYAKRQAWSTDDNPARPTYTPVVPALPPGVVIYVQLTQTGGSAGTQTTTSSWTYTAKDINNNQLGTSLSPAFGRRNGALAAATAGQGHFNTSGTFVLDLAFEGTGTGHC